MLPQVALVLACLAFPQLGLAKDPLANGKHYYKKGGRNDSRGPCPGLNSLANHGYLPRSGKKVNVVQLVAAALQGLGVSPETSGFVAAVGFGSSRHPLTLTFDLEDLSRPGLLIEHDASFSREDYAIGNNNVFNRTTWDVALAKFKHKSHCTSFDMGKVKSARIQDAKKRNPKSAYGPRASAFGAIEIGMIVSALGALSPPKTEWMRSIFEQERIPTHQGWKLSPLSDNVFLALARGVAALVADPKLLAHAGDVAISTPQELLATLEGLAGKSSSRKKGTPEKILKSKKGRGGKYSKGVTSKQHGQGGSSKSYGKSGSSKSSDYGEESEQYDEGGSSEQYDEGGSSEQYDEGGSSEQYDEGGSSKQHRRGEESAMAEQADATFQASAAEQNAMAAQMSDIIAEYGFTAEVMKEIRRMAAEDDVYRE